MRHSMQVMISNDCFLRSPCLWVEPSLQLGRVSIVHTDILEIAVCVLGWAPAGVAAAVERSKVNRLNTYLCSVHRKVYRFTSTTLIVNARLVCTACIC